jgi:hypothetical protein
VIEGRRIVENGPPQELLAKDKSATQSAPRRPDNHQELWRGGAWRHWWLADGRLVEKPAP